MKRIFGALFVGAVLLAAPLPGRAEFQPYPCVDPDNAGSVCSYDKDSVVFMGDKAKVVMRQVYPSPLPKIDMTDTVEIIVNCASNSYKFSSGTRTCPNCRPAMLKSAPFDRELLGSVYEGLYGLVCKKKKGR